MKRNLTVVVDTPLDDIKKIYDKAVAKSIAEYADTKYDYYNIYLNQIFGKSVIDIPTHMQNLNDLKEVIHTHIIQPNIIEQRFVKSLLDRNEYMTKSTSHPGVVVKLFRAFHQGRRVMVKTYIYDAMCKSREYIMVSRFRDEALFQYYIHSYRGKLSFISPQLYTLGQLIEFPFIRNNYRFKCLYLIMEDIQGVTLGQAIYNAETMKSMYEKVGIANREMIAIGVHHNDLHSNNVIVMSDSPLPEIAVLDFGEASVGPRKPLFQPMHISTDDSRL